MILIIELLERLIRILWYILFALGLIAAIGCGILFVRFVWGGLFDRVSDNVKYPVDLKNCTHGSSQYDEGHPDFPWKCHDCGKRH